MLEIILAKFEVILASETPSFIPVLVQMYFFLTFKRCSSQGTNAAQVAEGTNAAHVVEGTNAAQVVEGTSR